MNGGLTSARRHFDGAQYAEIYAALGNPGIKALDRLVASGEVLRPDRGRYVARAPTTQTVPQGSRQCQCPHGHNRACGVVISPRRRHEGGTGGRLGPTTATHLASVIGVDRSATTRYASKLERAGLVGREPDPDDARATRLMLTPAGLHALAAIREALDSEMGAILDTWPVAEAENFAAALTRFTDVLGTAQQ